MGWPRMKFLGSPFCLCPSHTLMMNRHPLVSVLHVFLSPLSPSLCVIVLHSTIMSSCWKHLIKLCLMLRKSYKTLVPRACVFMCVRPVCPSSTVSTSACWQAAFSSTSPNASWVTSPGRSCVMSSTSRLTS